VAQGNPVGGALGALDASDAGHAQHIALAGLTRLDAPQRLGLHADAATRHAHPHGGRLGRHINHVGLALGIKVGEFGHGV